MYYNAPFWSIHLPPGWQAEEDENCVALCAEKRKGGALQISCFRKEAGKVTAEDLREFAKDDLTESVTVEQTSCGYFAGIHFRQQVDDTYFRKWFLGAENLMLLITYNAGAANHGVEDATVDAMLHTLKPKDTG